MKKERKEKKGNGVWIFQLRVPFPSRELISVLARDLHVALKLPVPERRHLEMRAPTPGSACSMRPRGFFADSSESLAEGRSQL